MKIVVTIMSALVIFSTASAQESNSSDLTNIECRDLKSNRPVATLSSVKTYSEAINFGLFEVVRGAKGVLKFHETGESVDVTTWVAEGMTLNVRAKEKNGILVNLSGAAMIIKDGYNVRDLSCDGFETNKWPRMND